MKPDDQQPKPKPSGSTVPPRPPIRTAVGLDSGGEEPDKHVRVIGRDGRQLGIMMLFEAMKIADTERAELVKIAQAASPPVYRMVDQKPRHK
jgi:Translation initiation factor IF-3, N-terminal domain